LYLDQPNSAFVYRFRRPDGTPAHLPGLRLVAYVNLSPLVIPGPTAVRPAYPHCVLDTGSYLTTIPERIWGWFRPGAVTPLPFDPAMPVSLRSVDLPGGKFRYDPRKSPSASKIVPARRWT
jgi:hypothetical protein